MLEYMNHIDEYFQKYWMQLKDLLLFHGDLEHD